MTTALLLAPNALGSQFRAYRVDMDLPQRSSSVPTPADNNVVQPQAAQNVGVGNQGPDVATVLMARVQQGDRDAFAGLYDELASLVYGIVLRVVRDPAISEEVTQEIFVEMWKTAQRFDADRGSVKTWSATIARRRAVDRVRSVEAARRRDQADANVQPVEQAGVDDEVVGSMESARVRAALEVLSDKQRAAIELAYFDGKSYREVAEALQLPEGTVKSRIRDGMNRLRVELQGESS